MLCLVTFLGLNLQWVSKHRIRTIDSWFQYVIAVIILSCWLPPRIISDSQISVQTSITNCPLAASWA